ncbi:MAG: polyribonucleotide nucleotidyltransferase [Patescibacteria group bacterium]|nr:polyribonucleotide nucleotidyltransferase [Patescibacteria group bacterium]
MDKNKKIYKTMVAGRELTLEFFYLAQQANGSVLAKYGNTAVLATAVMDKSDGDGDYLPLRVEYEEKFYAAGKILGSRFLRRESRASDEAVLSGRLVDRTIRPLFDQRIRRDIQVVTTVLAYDEKNDPDFLSLLGASTALAVSDIPWHGPAAGIKVAKIKDNYVVNPSEEELKGEGVVFETFAAGPKEKISMIELKGNEAQEKEIMEAFKIAQKEIDALVDLQNKIVSEIGKEKSEVKLAEADAEIKKAVEEFLAPKLEGAVYQKNKADHYGKLDALQNELLEHLKNTLFAGEKEKYLNKDIIVSLFDEFINQLVHKNAIEKEMRPDGRKMDQVRDLSAEVGVLTRVHGSALFNRGETQALAITTLAAPGSEQLINTMRTDGKKRFLLHYDFPPYSVGEIGSFRGPGRRELGHGALAEKALTPMIPSVEEFPYVIRLVSEILGSNGSSSMATVCSGSLSLMDAGVPIKKPVGGIAMGLMIDDEGKNYKILTDIQGPEDHHGDMDFKVAGTEDGVNAVQLDVKFMGLSFEIIEKTLAQAKKARLEILGFMKTIIASPRPQLSSFAPSIISFKINPERIGEVIGPGGKNINSLIERTGVLGINIEDDGSVFVSADKKEKAEAAANEIKQAVRDFKVGEMVEGTIIKILEFGAIVDLGGGRDGMIHVSELKEGFVKKVEDVVKVGDFVRAKVIRVEPDRIGLSLKQV